MLHLSLVRGHFFAGALRDLFGGNSEDVFVPVKSY